MVWLGLTGGIASGKSTVANLLREAGIPVVDADELARQAVSPGSPALGQIMAKFGSEVLMPNGELNRAALGKVVFANPEKLRQLEGILHPIIQNLRSVERRRLETEGHAIAFYDVPLLFEKNMSDEFDQVVLVYCPESLQRLRLKSRDGLSDVEIDQRLAAQINIEKKKSMADFVLDNSGDVSALLVAVGDLLSKFAK